ncbi:MAG: hypothetical protein NVSMB47_20720 [Polyangiales bacterium]
MSAPIRLASAVAALALLCASCALTSKADSVFFRYFTPERLSPRSLAATGADASTLQLRLGRVTSASYLKEPIAFRESESEVGFYEQLLWTERPEAYLRRATSRTLFEERHLRQIVGGPGPTLEVELAVFEELRAPRHAARVVLSWMLRSDQLVVAQRTLTVEHPIGSAKGDAQANAVATAMGDALGEAIDGMAAAVVVELSRLPAPAPTPAPASSTAVEH